MEIRVLGAHNVETREIRHTCFLIDGVLGIDAGSLVSALGSAELHKIEALLLTHQHFDHNRDIPTLGIAMIDQPGTVEVYALSETLESVRRHLMDGQIYPDMTKSLNEAPPKYRFNPVKPLEPFLALAYEVMPVPMPHPVPAVGYIVRAPSGACMAYTGDTSGDLMSIFQAELAPKVMFVDVTYPNKLEWRAKLAGHLTPALLGYQLREAFDAKLALPRIVPVHMSPQHREELRQELSAVGSELGIDLTPGYEGMVVVEGAP